jgi:hypothetical protein
MTLTDQNCMTEKIKSILNLGNAWYHLVQNILSFCLLANINIKIYRTIILPIVIYGFETWCCMLREEHRQRVFKNSVLRKILMRNTELTKKFMICTAYQLLLE